MHLNLGTVDVFMPALVAGASDQLRESMLGVAKTSAEIECAKLQQQIAKEAQRQEHEPAARQARARIQAVIAAQHEKDKKKGMGNPPKKPRKDPAVAGVDDEEEEEEDLEEVLEKGKHK